MKTKTKILALILFFSTLGLKAQVPVAEKNDVTSVPSVSQEDLKKTADDLKKVVRQELAKASASASAQAAKAREDARLLHEKEMADARAREAKAKADFAMEETLRQKAAEKSAKNLQNKLIAGTSGLGVLVLGVGLVVWKKKADPVLVVEKQAEGRALKTMTNPELRDLKKFATSSNAKKVLFVRKLEPRGTVLDGEEIVCMALMQDHGRDPLVLVGDETTPVAWDKHVTKAVKLIAAKKNVSAIQPVRPNGTNIN